MATTKEKLDQMESGHYWVKFNEHYRADWVIGYFYGSGFMYAGGSYGLDCFEDIDERIITRRERENETGH